MRISMAPVLFIFLLTACDSKIEVEQKTTASQQNIANSQTQIVNNNEQKKLSDAERQAAWKKACNTEGKYDDLSKHSKPLP